MQINWSEFTPIASLAGGLLIGLSAALMVLLNGRVVGISSIIRNAFGRDDKEVAWRLSFIFGVLASPTLYFFIYHDIQVTLNDNLLLLIISGLLVGYGSALGSGCTSGHAVCGLARFSKRSLVAVLIFMSASFITTFLLRHG